MSEERIIFWIGFWGSLIMTVFSRWWGESELAAVFTFLTLAFLTLFTVLTLKKVEKVIGTEEGVEKE